MEDTNPPNPLSPGSPWTLLSPLNVIAPPTGSTMDVTPPLSYAEDITLPCCLAVNITPPIRLAKCITLSGPYQPEALQQRMNVLPGSPGPPLSVALQELHFMECRVMLAPAHHITWSHTSMITLLQLISLINPYIQYILVSVCLGQAFIICWHVFFALFLFYFSQ